VYYNKKIIILSGKIGSGKSYLLNILKENTDTLCFDCDKMIKNGWPKEERLQIIEKFGIAYLEKLIYPDLKLFILNTIKYSKHKAVAIEGIKAKQLFKDIMDVEIVFDVPESIRRKRVLERGDSIKKFNYFNKLQSG